MTDSAAPEPTRVLSPPGAVRRIAARLENAGFETWCVGGAVRDALLGRTHADWDLATAATPPDVRALFRRTVPHGIEFGTVGVIDRAGVMHEVTTFRRDVNTDGRHAVVEFGVSLDDDLARRDFTINAIAYSPRTGALRDPFGGLADLRGGIVRAVGTASARMTEDRLRALRAFRFAGRFGFTIEPGTWEAIVASAPFLPRLSRERIRQELEKTMDQVRCPSHSLVLWQEAGAFAAVVPELAALGRSSLRAPDFIATPDATSRPELKLGRRRNRLAALLLDLDVKTCRAVLEGLRSSNKEVDWVSHLVACWHAAGGDMGSAIRAGRVEDAALRRWASAIGRTVFRDFVRVAHARWSADALAGGEQPHREAVRSSLRRGLRIAYRDPIAVADLALDGGDLIAMGVPAGPAVGAMLRRLLEAVLRDPALNHRDRLAAQVRAWQEPRP